MLAATFGTAASSTWPTDHGNSRRTGYLPTLARHKALAPAFTARVDGAMYASPLLVGTDVIAATENNTVYAFNALTGKLHWARHLRTPAPTSSLACPGNISPSGITGTPAYDPVTNRIFVMTNSVNAQFGAHHEIFGLNASTGAVAMNRRIAVPGTAENATQQRAALAVSNGNVFVAFGGLAGDCGNYKGAVISLRADGRLGATAWIVPTGREGGIWASGGPVVAQDGSVFVSVGNGASTSGSYDGSDSVTRISAKSQRMDFFAPTSWAPDNAADLDLGSMTPAFTANGYILQAGKSGQAYVLKGVHLGGIGGQVYTAPLCKAFGVSAVTNNVIYLPCTNGITRVEVDSAGRFRKVWTASGVNSSPVVGNGAIYAVTSSSLVALNSAGTQIGSIALGAATTRFTTPALAGNKVYVGTVNSLVAIRVG